MNSNSLIMKLTHLPLVLSTFGLLFLFSCEKEEFEPTLGATQTNFNLNEIYQAESDGLLTVHYKTSGFGTDTWVKIYVDASSEPTTLKSEMAITGASTIPLHKDQYWKVVQGPTGTTTIEFTPFQ